MHKKIPMTRTQLNKTMLLYDLGCKMSTLFQKIIYSNQHDSNKELFQLLFPLDKQALKIMLKCLVRKKFQLSKHIWQIILQKLVPIKGVDICPEEWGSSVYRWMSEYWIKSSYIKEQNPLLISYGDMLTPIQHLARYENQQIGAIVAMGGKESALLPNIYSLTKVLDLFIGLHVPNVDLFEEIRLIKKDGTVVGKIDFQTPSFYEFKKVTDKGIHYLCELPYGEPPNYNNDELFPESTLPFYHLREFPIIPVCNIIFEDLSFSITLKDRGVFNDETLTKEMLVLGTLLHGKIRDREIQNEFNMGIFQIKDGLLKNESRITKSRKV
jgi:hypothetical protein